MPELVFSDVKMSQTIGRKETVADRITSKYRLRLDCLCNNSVLVMQAYDVNQAHDKDHQKLNHDHRSAIVEFNEVEDNLVGIKRQAFGGRNRSAICKIERKLKGA